MTFVLFVAIFLERHELATKGTKGTDSAQRHLRTQRIQWADGGAGEAAHDMRVDHGGFDTPVAEVFLHFADVHSAHQEMRGEGVAQRVRPGMLGDTGPYQRLPHRALGYFLADVVSPYGT